MIPKHYSAHSAGPSSGQLLNMLLQRQTGGSREPWGHSSWCPRVHCNTIKMHVSFTPMPAPSLCHFSGRWDFRGEQKHFNDSRGDTWRDPGRQQDEVMGCRPGTIRYSVFYIVCVMQMSPVWKGRVWMWYYKLKKGQKVGKIMLSGKERKLKSEFLDISCWLNKAPTNHDSSSVSRPHWGHSECFVKILAWCQRFGTWGVI